MEAMKYEGVDITHGGAAIRFDYYNGQCRIDREMMMRGNLDSSGGRPLSKLSHCGNDGIDYFYWRPAAGAADAANLRSAGTCAMRHNFTRVKPARVGKPMGRLPDGYVSFVSFVSFVLFVLFVFFFSCSSLYISLLKSNFILLEKL